MLSPEVLARIAANKERALTLKRERLARAGQQGSQQQRGHGGAPSSNDGGQNSGGPATSSAATPSVPRPDQYDYSAYGGYEAYMAQAAAAARGGVTDVGGQSKQQASCEQPNPGAVVNDAAAAHEVSGHGAGAQSTIQTRTVAQTRAQARLAPPQPLVESAREVRVIMQEQARGHLGPAGLSAYQASCTVLGEVLAQGATAMSARRQEEEAAQHKDCLLQDLFAEHPNHDAIESNRLRGIGRLVQRRGDIARRTVPLRQRAAAPETHINAQARAYRLGLRHRSASLAEQANPGPAPHHARPSGDDDRSSPQPDSVGSGGALCTHKGCKNMADEACKYGACSRAHCAPPPGAETAIPTPVTFIDGTTVSNTNSSTRHGPRESRTGPCDYINSLGASYRPVSLFRSRPEGLVPFNTMRVVAPNCRLHSRACAETSCLQPAPGCEHNLCHPHCLQRYLGRSLGGGRSDPRANARFRIGAEWHPWNEAIHIYPGPAQTFSFGRNALCAKQTPPITDCRGWHACCQQADWHIPCSGNNCDNPQFPFCANKLCPSCCNVGEGGVPACLPCTVGDTSNFLSQEDAVTCLICSDEMPISGTDPRSEVQAVGNFFCSHLFHEPCIARWLQSYMTLENYDHRGSNRQDALVQIGHCNILCPACRAYWVSTRRNAPDRNSAKEPEMQLSTTLIKRHGMEDPDHPQRSGNFRAQESTGIGHERTKNWPSGCALGCGRTRAHRCNYDRCDVCCLFSECRNPAGDRHLQGTMSRDAVHIGSLMTECEYCQGELDSTQLASRQTARPKERAFNWFCLCTLHVECVEEHLEGYVEENRGCIQECCADPMGRPYHQNQSARCPICRAMWYSTAPEYHGGGIEFSKAPLQGLTLHPRGAGRWSVARNRIVGGTDATGFPTDAGINPCDAADINREIYVRRALYFSSLPLVGSSRSTQCLMPRCGRQWNLFCVGNRCSMHCEDGHCHKLELHNSARCFIEGYQIQDARREASRMRAGGVEDGNSTIRISPALPDSETSLLVGALLLRNHDAAHLQRATPASILKDIRNAGWAGGAYTYNLRQRWCGGWNTVGDSAPRHETGASTLSQIIPMQYAGQTTADAADETREDITAFFRGVICEPWEATGRAEQTGSCGSSDSIQTDPSRPSSLPSAQQPLATESESGSEVLDHLIIGRGRARDNANDGAENGTDQGRQEVSGTDGIQGASEALPTGIKGVEQGEHHADLVQAQRLPEACEDGQVSEDQEAEGDEEAVASEGGDRVLCPAQNAETQPSFSLWRTDPAGRGQDIESSQEHRAIWEQLTQCLSHGPATAGNTGRHHLSQNGFSDSEAFGPPIVWSDSPMHTGLFGMEADTWRVKGVVGHLELRKVFYAQRQEDPEEEKTAPRGNEEFDLRPSTLADMGITMVGPEEATATFLQAIIDGRAASALNRAPDPDAPIETSRHCFIGAFNAYDIVNAQRSFDACLTQGGVLGKVRIKALRSNNEVAALINFETRDTLPRWVYCHVRAEDNKAQMCPETSRAGGEINTDNEQGHGVYGASDAKDGTPNKPGAGDSGEDNASEAQPRDGPTGTSASTKVPTTPGGVNTDSRAAVTGTTGVLQVPNCFFAKAATGNSRAPGGTSARGAGDNVPNVTGDASNKIGTAGPCASSEIQALGSTSGRGTTSEVQMQKGPRMRGIGYYAPRKGGGVTPSSEAGGSDDVDALKCPSEDCEETKSQSSIQGVGTALPRMNEAYVTGEGPSTRKASSPPASERGSQHAKQFDLINNPPRSQPIAPGHSRALHLTDKCDFLDNISFDHIRALGGKTRLTVPFALCADFERALNRLLRYTITKPIDPQLTGITRLRGSKLMALFPALAMRKEEKGTDGHRTQLLGIRLKMLNKGEWEKAYHQLTTDVSNRSAPATRGDRLEKAMIKRSEELIECGELSRAMRNLSNTGTCPANRDTFERLANLHPKARREWTQEDFEEVPGAPEVKFKLKSFRQALQKLERGSAPGPMAFRSDWLRLLVPTNEEMEAKEEIDNPIYPLMKFTEMLMNGHLGLEATQAMGAARIMGLVKEGSEEPRPLAIGEAIRRLGAKAIMIQHEVLFGEVLAPVGQMGVGIKSAADKMVIERRLRIEARSSRVIVAVDTANAFNSIDRRRILANLKRDKRLHFLIPTFKAFYRHSASLYFKAKDSEMTLLSRTGVQQGDGLGPLFYAIGTIDSLQELREKFREQDIGIRAYLDDVTFDCEVNMAEEIYSAWCDILKRNTGQVCRPEKTKAWSPCTDISGLDHRFEKAPCRGKDGGVKIMGIPIGTKEYEMRVTTEAFDKFKGEYEMVVKLPNKQQRFLLLRYCQGAGKINHLMRGVKKENCIKMLEAVDKYNEVYLEKLMASPKMNTTQKDLCHLSPSYGGMGLRAAYHNSDGAWIGAWATSVGTAHPLGEGDKLVTDIIENLERNSGLPTVKHLTDLWDYHTKSALPGFAVNMLRQSVQRVSAGLPTESWLSSHEKKWKRVHVLNGQIGKDREGKVSAEGSSWALSVEKVASAIRAMPTREQSAALGRNSRVPVSLLADWAKATKSHQRRFSGKHQWDVFDNTIAHFRHQELGEGLINAQIRGTCTFESSIKFAAIPSRKCYVITDGGWSRAAIKRMPGMKDPLAEGLQSNCPCCRGDAPLEANAHLDVCRARGRPTYIHNVLRGELLKAGQAAGLPAALEQRHLVPEVGSGNARPGDVTIHIGDDRICVDVGRTSYRRSAARVNADSEAPAGFAANRYEAEKAHKRYKDHMGGSGTMGEYCRREGLVYKPACVDNVGCFGNGMEWIFTRLARASHANQGIPTSVHSLVWKRRISIAMANAEGAAAQERVRDLIRLEGSDQVQTSLERSGVFDVRNGFNQHAMAA